MTAADNTMEFSKRLLSVLLIEKSLSAQMRIKVEAQAMHMVQHLTADAGDFLHYDLDADLHTEEEVKTLIDAFPSALSQIRLYDYGSDDDEPIELLPIQAAGWNHDGRNCIPFIPLLAEEGRKLNVGGEGKRGGLILKDNPDGENVLQELARIESSADDSTSLHVLKRLRESDLLKKEDIRQYDLLWYSCKSQAKERFEYFIYWDPEALKEYQCRGDPLLQANTCGIIDHFAMALKAGLKYYPEELGFLFRKNGEGETALKLAFERYGKGEAWRAIEKCFEETRDVKMVERNPTTNMYPFMLATLASAGETSELNTMYFLLRRDPIVFDRVADGFAESKRSRQTQPS